MIFPVKLLRLFYCGVRLLRRSRILPVLDTTVDLSLLTQLQIHRMTGALFAIGLLLVMLAVI